MAKLTVLPRLGCEGLADMRLQICQRCIIPHTGERGAARLWCYRVRSSKKHKAIWHYREGHAEWQEDLFEES